jgi:hypothetical protein
MTLEELQALPSEEALAWARRHDPEIGKIFKRCLNFTDAWTRGIISTEVWESGVKEEVERLYVRCDVLWERMKAGEFR